MEEKEEGKTRGNVVLEGWDMMQKKESKKISEFEGRSRAKLFLGKWGPHLKSKLAPQTRPSQPSCQQPAVQSRQDLSHMHLERRLHKHSLIHLQTDCIPRV